MKTYTNVSKLPAWLAGIGRSDPGLVPLDLVEDPAEFPYAARAYPGGEGGPGEWPGAVVHETDAGLCLVFPRPGGGAAAVHVGVADRLSGDQRRCVILQVLCALRDHVAAASGRPDWRAEADALDGLFRLLVTGSGVLLAAQPADQATLASTMVRHGVTAQMVADQVIAAIEGGSNYWCRRAELVFPSREDVGASPPAGGEALPWYSSPLLWGENFLVAFYEDGERQPIHLTPGRLGAGLDWMAKNDPDGLAAIVQEDGDADTADTLLQACLFGERRYG